MLTRTATAFWIFALCGPLACTTGAGDGRVWGALYLPECDINTTEYDMKVDFFAASEFNNTLTIRLQRSGKDQNVSDGVILVIRDLNAIAQVIETEGVYRGEIALEPTIDAFIENGPNVGTPQTKWDSVASATLYLNRTCPQNTLAFTDGAGTFEFSGIYVPDKHTQIIGSFDFRFIDPRFWTDAAPGQYGPRASIHGVFDFNYTRGSPAQTFP